MGWSEWMWFEISSNVVEPQWALGGFRTMESTYSWKVDWSTGLGQLLRRLRVPRHIVIESGFTACWGTFTLDGCKHSRKSQFHWSVFELPYIMRWNELEGCVLQVQLSTCRQQPGLLKCSWARHLNYFHFHPLLLVRWPRPLTLRREYR